MPSAIFSGLTMNQSSRTWLYGHARHLGAGDPRDRAVEVVERLLGDDRRDLRAVAAELVVLVDDQALAGLADRVEQRLAVERAERPQVDDLDADAVVGDPVGRLERVVRHQPVGDDRDLRARVGDLGLAERDRVVGVGDVAADRAVHLLVLEEQHRVVVADRRAQQAAGVVRRGRHDDLEARARG